MRPREKRATRKTASEVVADHDIGILPPGNEDDLGAKKWTETRHHAVHPATAMMTRTGIAVIVIDRGVLGEDQAGEMMALQEAGGGMTKETEGLLHVEVVEVVRHLVGMMAILLLMAEGEEEEGMTMDLTEDRTDMMDSHHLPGDRTTVCRLVEGEVVVEEATGIAEAVIEGEGETILDSVGDVKRIIISS